MGLEIRYRAVRSLVLASCLVVAGLTSSQVAAAQRDASGARQKTQSSHGHHGSKRCRTHKRIARRCARTQRQQGPSRDSSAAAPTPLVVTTSSAPTSDSPPTTVPAQPGNTSPVAKLPAEPSPPTETGEQAEPPPVAEPTPPPPAEEPGSSAGLEWQPPELQNPITIELGNGYTHTALSTHRDYIVKLPPGQKVGGTWLDGGHNVVVIGGSITIPTGTQPGVANDAQRRAIYIKGATGTVHIEGVSIEGSGAEFDGIDINAPAATVQLENLRVAGIKGRSNGFHGDVVQAWGGVEDLRIDRLSATSNYQGLMLKQDLGPIDSVELSDVDLTATTEAPLEKGGHMLWLSSGDGSCANFPATLASVFVQPRPGSDIGAAVWPEQGSPMSCAAQGNSFASWPNPMIVGGAQEGSPPDGSFVPPGTAGPEYRSPGYSG